jgi:hypothetical protein
MRHGRLVIREKFYQFALPGKDPEPEIQDLSSLDLTQCEALIPITAAFEVLTVRLKSPSPNTETREVQVPGGQLSKVSGDISCREQAWGQKTSKMKKKREIKLADGL